MNCIFTIFSKVHLDIYQIIPVFVIVMRFYVNVVFLGVFVLRLFISFLLANCLDCYIRFELFCEIMNVAVLMDHFVLLINLVALMLRVVSMIIVVLMVNDTLIRNLAFVGFAISLRLMLNM